MRSILLGICLLLVAESPVSSQQVLTLSDGKKIASGTLNKQGPVITIPFNTTFSATPIVVISPFYEGGGEVGHTETITEIDTDRFQVTGGNAAPNYYINWIAVDQTNGSVLPNGQMIVAGTAKKPVISLQGVKFGTTFVGKPNVQISPFWNGRGEVGGVDTVTDIETDQFTVVSGNRASDYMITWIAVGTPRPAPQ